MKTTTAELQMNHIQERFENLEATYKRVGDIIIVSKNKEMRSFSLMVHSIADFEKLLKEWGERHE